MRKKLEKIIALLISLMMLTISCEFYISAVSAELINSITIGLPVIKEIIAVEKFEGTNISENWDLILDDGNITQEDGRLKIVGVSGSGQTLARYTPLLGDTAKGMIGVEFYLEKANAERAYIYIRPASGHFFSGQWRENGDIYGYYRDNPDAEAVNRKIGNIHPTEKAHFMFLFDTEKEIFSLWINGNLIIDKKLSRTPEIKDVRCIEIYPRPTSDATIYVERLKVYHAIPLLEDALDYDYEWLTDTILLKGNPNAYAGDVIDSDLHLPKKARFISDITWHSSDETLITNEGKVTRPVGGLSDPEVTLTATLSAKGLTREKIFKFKVLRLLTSSEDIVNADYEFLDYSTLSMDKSNRVRTSINFMEKGMYGSDIVWSSSDTSAIIQSGRVIRPKVGEPDKEVEVTAVIRYGDVSRVKKFNFTVLADEEFVDPQYASDEEFFGVWDQSKEKWSIPGSINYSYSNELKPVEEAVKMGNYSLAKEALLTYFRNKDYPAVTSTLTDLGGRDKRRANITIDDHYTMQSAGWDQGEFYAENEWKFIFVDMKLDHIAKGGTSCYDLNAWYNEASTLEIVSNNHPDESLHPRMELVINGITKVFHIKEDATVRAGVYYDKNYGMQPVNIVRTYGEFLGNETIKTMLKFNFTDIKEDDVIESARLVLYCRAVPEFSGRKRILVTKNTSLWNEAEVTWKDILWNIGSYNGLPGKNDWKQMPYGDRNLFLEEVRFRSLPSVAIEYIITEDETYAYGAIRIMEDFITDTGGWYPPGAPEGRGGYTRSLDTARRAQSWMAVYRVFVQSENMNPENNTAILKNINDMGKSLYYVHADKGNWKSTEMWVLTELATMFPEFTNSGKWFELGRLEREQVVFDSYFSDGSYVEATGGYNKSSINAAIAYKKMVMNQGLAVSPEFDELLEKAAYYNLLLRAPDGTSIQFGDEAGGEKGKKTGSWFQDIVNWYDNREIEYIDTFGKRGIMPEWTSMHWPDSRITAMRSSWRPDALYMFTNVRGKGQHGHADDNHVTVYAFDKILLTDAGKYTYEWDSPTKIWINSTRAHNTVEINNKSQEQTPTTSYTIHTVEGRGDIHDWLTNNSFDFLSQSTKNTRGFDHRRTITFVKPYLWIVSDLITPNDLSSINSYKQLWHMVPSANLSIDDENKIIRSNFDQGANIIVASADGDNITTKVEMGLYDLSENQIQDTPYGYFSLEGVQGKATFDTVLVPTRNDVNAEVTAERLDTGVATNIATALKFTARSKGDANTGYYYLSYEDNPQSERNFGKYTTDGQLAFVFEGNKEDIRNIIIKNASLLKNNTDGSILLSYPGKISDMSLEWKGNRLIIRTADKDINYSNLMIATSDIVKSLLINGQETEFSIENGYIVTDGKKKTDADSKSGGAGGTIIVEGKGGTSPSGGNSGGSSIPIGDTERDEENLPETKKIFKDLDGHWAKNEIEYLYDAGIILGKQDNIFAPEDKITRAEFLALIIRALSIDETDYSGTTFIDVSSDDWYSTAIETGLKLGLIAEDDFFRPNDPVNREEMVKMIIEAYIIKKEIIITDEYQSDYADEADISSWAIEYVNQADYLNLVKGVGNGRFAPKENATRAQAAVIIKRLLEKIM